MATITSPRSESPAISIHRVTSPSTPGANDTPSSSVRPSIEIPRNNASSPALQQNVIPAPTTTQRRNRAALRDYYNLKSRAPSGASQDLNISRTASIASNASDSTITSSAPVPEPSSLTTQMDHPTFDAKAYVSELLKTASLRDILRTEGVLVSEIRNLDGERKALVYDNYSKLIKAVETIAEVQKGMHKKGADRSSVLGREREPSPGFDGVQKLEEKLDGLLKVVKELNPAEREGMKQSIEVREKRRQKETVQWALDAPSRLQNMIAQGRRDAAMKEYKSVIGLLDQWKGVGGVNELRAKCENTMESPDHEAKDAED
ncbi:uncharacterized protein Z518_09993 [Rhinocladiella mackenziei CBS 650.93]|uniref:Vacuolar protein sorting-associated protein 51 homolog n=1 Tax=Rhinocladiella mackenziei CBS 650.93 TaxID=1442369 RepID=A0A0D2GRJ8_9EURO|nr:uncharacterized protein Z518_09993 [Rhinocladiella mackenziei CBS 650.93]KIX00928.1 hypothetical protein Z518_09993 [Rhinocladiella mackenziei CBS 650.93]